MIISKNHKGWYKIHFKNSQCWRIFRLHEFQRDRSSITEIQEYVVYHDNI